MRAGVGRFFYRLVQVKTRVRSLDDGRIGCSGLWCACTAETNHQNRHKHQTTTTNNNNTNNNNNNNNNNNDNNNNNKTTITTTTTKTTKPPARDITVEELRRRLQRHVASRASAHYAAPISSSASTTPLPPPMCVAVLGVRNATAPEADRVFEVLGPEEDGSRVRELLVGRGQQGGASALLVCG